VNVPGDIGTGRLARTKRSSSTKVEISSAGIMRRIRRKEKDEIMVKIEVKCVGCGEKKELVNEKIPDEQPMCDKCGMPMIAMKAELDTRSNDDIENDDIEDDEIYRCDGCGRTDMDSGHCPLCCNSGFSPGSEECDFCSYSDECAEHASNL